MFKKYPKIHILGKEETEGILNGNVHIEEKLDGANTSIWIDNNGKIHCSSRNRELKEIDDDFNGFVKYVNENEAIKTLLKENPKYRLYGEWLVRHTISYKETAYKKFYLFDITIMSYEEREEFLKRDEVIQIADKYGIPRPEYHGSFNNPTEDVIKQFAGRSTLGEIGEGVVIKNDGYKNKFGDHCYAKIVTEKFKERKSLTFDNNDESNIVNNYITLERVRKIMHKIQPEINEELGKQHTARIANSVYHDVITEDMWEIAKKVANVNFRTLKKLAHKRSIQVYHDILEDNLSIADNK